MPKDGNTNRKDSPVFSGVMQYFPDALMEIARHSKRGNDKHNPGEPLHWAKDKSKDQADCVARHLIDIGPNWDALDPETGSYHATALAWRALALLQTLLEKATPKIIKADTSDSSKGLAAWLPTAEETKEFFTCKCGEPGGKTCYAPQHRGTHK